MQYQIHIHDRNYSSWEIQPREEENPFDKTPFDKKLFHEDTFEIKENQEPEIHIVKSPTREAKYIAGILLLEKNKTFGRTPNKKRLYYSCIPHDKHLPNFLIPYEIDIGFEKVFPNKYVLFRFDHWTEQEKHPYGLLVETIGDVTELVHYDTYQLYAKNLSLSTKTIQKQIQKQKTTLETSIQEILSEPTRYGIIQDRTQNNPPIFSIDPEGCMDRDDALSIRNSNTTYQISVYIANMAVWIEYFQLYSFLQDTNISTIYLQDRTIPMLPTVLSEKIASLDTTHDCFAMAMDFEVDILAKTIRPIRISSCLIRVQRNFDYESRDLLRYSPYKDLLKITQIFHSEIRDSHELVAFWMMQMNREMAQELYRNKTGIFRISTTTKPNRSKEEKRKKDPTKDIFFYIWENAISGKYVEYSEDMNITDYTHEILDVPIYTHITSPIRRFVDIYNQIAWTSIHIKRETNLKPCINKINQDTKHIRKIQQESKLLYFLHHNQRQFVKDTENLLGFGFGLELPCTIIGKESDTNKISIYIPEIKSMYLFTPLHPIVFDENTMDSVGISSYETIQKCSLYMFEREHDYRKKIKVIILS